MPDQHPLADLDPVIHAPARLMIMTTLVTVDSADFIFLMRLTGLTWGNLSSHLSKLESSGYVAIEKEIRHKKIHTRVRLTPPGRKAFRAYQRLLRQTLDELPD